MGGRQRKYGRGVPLGARAVRPDGPAAGPAQLRAMPMASRMARPDAAVGELAEVAGEPLTGGPAAEVTAADAADAVLTTVVRAGWLWVQSRSPAEDSWQIGPCRKSGSAAEAAASGTDAATTTGAAAKDAAATVGAPSSW